MVVSRNELNPRQRKKGGETLVQPPNTENGKRTKVHAQRKFAQGSALSSPALTPVKDKHKSNGSLVSTEIIPAKRPKTHDFLTFLCLRGTPILPTRLDFFSISSSDSQNDDDIASNSYSSAKAPAKLPCNSKNTAEKSSDHQTTSAGKQRNDTPQQNGTQGPKRRSSTVYVPTSTVQALKKKYQDQRLSKQNRSGVLNKLAQRVKDKNMVRTRSAGQVEHPKKVLPTEAKSLSTRPKSISKPTEMPNLKPRRATRSSGIPLSPVAPAVKTHKKRIGLRSGGVAPKALELLRSKPKKVAVVSKKPVASSMSDFSSDDDEPLSKKAKTKAGKVEVSKNSLKQVQAPPHRQRKQSQSPVRIQTRSRRTGDSDKTEKKEIATSPQSQAKPQARLSRRTKEVATVYMELLGKKWRDPDDEEDDDDDDDDDSLSLYNFPELRRSSVEKKTSVVNKKEVKKKADLKKESEKKSHELSKKKEKSEAQDTKGKEKTKEEKKVRTRQSITSRSSPSPQRKSSSASSSPQRRPSMSSPGPQRRSLRGHLMPELQVMLSPPRKSKETTDPLVESVSFKATTKTNESGKHIETKKKVKKHEKPNKVKSSLSSIAKRTRLRSEKLKMNKESKKATLNKLLEQTKRKYLCTRKSKEACIQELVQSTLERLNKEKEKEEKEELKRAMQLDLKLQAEHKEKLDSKILDPILLDKKLKNLAGSSHEEKSPVKKSSLLAVPKSEIKSVKIEQKAKIKSKIMPSTDEPMRFIAKKTASIVPPPRKKFVNLAQSPNSATCKKAQDHKVSLPCSPVECKTAVSQPESHCTTCGRGEQSEVDKKVPEVSKSPAAAAEASSSTAVKNLNWGNISSFKLQTQSVKVSNTVVIAQKVSTDQVPHQPSTSTVQQKPPQLLPAQPMRLSNVTDMKTFVSGLAMLQPTNKNEQLVLLAPPNSGAGTGKYIVCRKEELAALESNPSCSGSGVQIMVLPGGVHGVTPEKMPAVVPQPKPAPEGELRNFRFKKADDDNNPNQEVKIASKNCGTSASQTVPVPKSPEEKRPIFQRRREKLMHSKKSDAFSPENESSVYAFQMDPEDEPTGIPFRRKNKEDSNSATPPTPPVTHSVGCSTESPPTKAVQPSPSVSSTPTPLTTFVSRNVSSNSIAVQVNFDEVASTSSESPSEPAVSPTTPSNATHRNSFECSTQTEDENEDDHLFYIPLQTGTPTPQQLIQGVEVKLGTEGPTGPNQRVIMRAKLVTKPPERFSAALNATGMVRSSQHPTSTLANAAGASLLKPPLVGTVQPTARCVPQPVPPTSAGQVQPSTTDTPTTMPAQKATVPPKVQKTPGSAGKLNKTASQPASNSTPSPAVSKQTVGNKASPPVTKQSPGVNKSLPSVSKSANASTKPQKLTSKRNSTDQPTAGPSTSTAKQAKRPPVQRQGSSSGAGGSGSKAPKVLEASPTPTSFPKPGGQAQLLEAPTFYPTEKDFQDPLEYIERIKPMAEQFGLCRIVPPSSFKPECKVSDDMRFTAYNHYVHKMLDRWGPNVKETTAIKKYLKSQNVDYTHPPWIGGMEIDLPRFYQTVKQLGGLMDVIEKKRWQKVADLMKIPKSAQDRVTKLDDIYCKFLLAYDTLTPEERQALFDEVEKEWAKKQELVDSLEDDDDNFDESEECLTKGRSMPLNAFYRIARNTMSMWFRTPEPSASDVEAEYWRIAQERTSHVCVHAGSIDSGVWGYGFPCNKNSPCAKHPWNLKVLSNNSGSVLRSMGSIMGVTVPTLHVGMLFSTCCWYRDPHGLPWIEYLHTGASKIWYGIPDSHSIAFRQTLNKVVPKYCRDQTIWLPSDTAMVPPSMLVPHGVSVCRTVQEPGQFILVFPRAFTSSVSTGYLVSESVYFAQSDWLSTADEVFKELKDSCEPTMFSLERLLFSIPQDHRTNVDVLRLIQPKLQLIIQREETQRETLRSLGLKSSERLPLPEAAPHRRRQRTASEDDGDHECEVCRANLYLSLVTNSHEEAVYCLPHAISLLTKKRHQLKFCKLLYTYEMDELQELLHQLEEKIEAKSMKKTQNKHSSSNK